MYVIELPKFKDGNEPAKILKRTIPKHDVKFERKVLPQILATKEFCPDGRPEVYALRASEKELHSMGRQVNTRSWPNRPVVQLCYHSNEKKDSSEEKDFKTGVMIGPRHVLTVRFFEPDQQFTKISVCYSGDTKETFEMVQHSDVTKIYASKDHCFAILLLDELICVKTGYLAVACDKTSTEEQKTQIFTVQGFPQKARHLKQIADVTQSNFVFDDESKGMVVKITSSGRSCTAAHTEASLGVQKDMCVELEYQTTEQRIAASLYQPEGRPRAKSIIQNKQVGNTSLIKLLKNIVASKESAVERITEAIELGYQASDFLTEAENTSVQFLLQFTLVRNTIVLRTWVGLPFVAFPDKADYARITDTEYHYSWNEGSDQGTIGSPVTLYYLNNSISGTFVVAMHTGNVDGICHAARITEDIFEQIASVLKATWQIEIA